MTVVATAAGVGLILLALGDIFLTVFHPLTRSGSLSRGIARVVWRAAHLGARGFLPVLAFAGPAAMVVIIAGWAGLLAVGWALVYWPRMPGGFLLQSGLDPAEHGGFGEALYVSLTTLATVGYGDVVPEGGWLRLLAPIQALVGLSLATAAISWILSTYPVLARRRSLAHDVWLLGEVERTDGLSPLELGESEASGLLADLATRLVMVREDLAQFPITYFFRGDDPRGELCPALPALADLALEAGSPACPPAVRFQGAILGRAVAALSEDIGRRFLRRPGLAQGEALAAFAADHRCGSGGDERGAALIPQPALPWAGEGEQHARRRPDSS